MRDGAQLDLGARALDVLALLVARHGGPSDSFRVLNSCRWMAATGRNYSFANVSFRASNFQRQLSGDDADEAAGPSRPISDLQR
jgi:hypothetical protein